MFIKNTWKEKLIVSLIVFCLALSHSLPLFAAFFQDTGNNQEDEILSNVEMSAYISSDTVENTESYVANTKEEGIILNVLMKVKNGYVKNPILSIADLSNEVFEIDETRLDCEYIQSVVGNEITISRLNSDEEVLVKIPIKLKDEEYYNPFKINSSIEFVLNGTYVDQDSNHVEFTKSTNAILGWDSICNVNLSSNVEKSFQYTQENTKYMLVQYAIDISLGEDSLTLPVEGTNVVFKVPQNDSLVPQSVTVDAVNTLFTNGLTGSEVLFNQNNWNYSNGNVNIDVLNAPVQEKDNKYIIPQGKDKYIVTVTYAVNGENTKLSSTISTKINVFNNGTTKTLESSGEIEYDLKDSKGSLVTYDIQSANTSLSKGNIYANYNLEKDYYETNYTIATNVNISKADFVNTIEIREQDEYFENDEEEKYSTLYDGNYMSYYKTTTFNKENLDSILGESGTLKILNENGEELITLDKNIEADENGNIVVSYSTAEKVGKIILRIDNPEHEGILSISNTKAIANVSYTKKSAMRFEKLVSKYVAAAMYDGDIKDDLGVVTNNIKLEGTNTSATVSTSRKVLSTLAEKNNLELKIALNNYNESADLYKNPVFEITLPKEIDEVKINDMSILYGNNELNISNVENYKNDKGNVVLKVSLKGTQTKYSLVELTEGTNVILDLDVKVNIYTPSDTKKITMTYYNESATNYNNAVPWRMDTNKTDKVLLNTNGTSETEISFIAPSGVVSAQKADGYNGKNEIYSINQGLKTDRILTDKEAKKVETDIILMNNSEGEMKNVSILGRTPFKGNKSISTGEDLGTTVDSKMVSRISETYGTYKEVEIYYSENGEATNDLNDANNGWSTEYEELENIKSYLIVFNETIKPGEISVFTYSYEIPEKLPCDTDIYTTFSTYYTNTYNENQSEEADIIGLETVSAPKIEVSITSDAGETVIEGQMIEYTVLVKNVGEVDAEDVNVTLDIPENTTYIEYNDGSLDSNNYFERKEDIKTVNIDVGDILVGEEKSYTYVVQVNTETKEISGAKVEASVEGLDEDGNPKLPEDEETNEPSEEPEKPAEPEVPETPEGEEGEISNDNESIIEDTTDDSNVEKPDLELSFTENYAGAYVRENADIYYYITITNNTDESMGATQVIYPDGTIKTYEEYLKEEEEKNNQAAENNEPTPEGEAEEELEFIMGKTLNNINISQNIPEGVTFDSAYIMEFDEETQFDKETPVGTYDEATRTYNLNIESLEVGESYELAVRVRTNYLEEIEKYMESQVIVTGDEIEDVVSYKIKNKIGRPNVETTFTSSADGQYVKEDEDISYRLVATNTGVFSAENLTVIDLLPEELKGLSGTYYLESDKKNVKHVNFITANKMSMVVTLEVDDTLVVDINTRARQIDEEEKEIDNNLSLESISFKNNMQTEPITTIVQQKEDTPYRPSSDDKNNVVLIKKNESEQSTNDSKASNKITGRAWLDKNKNGKRDQNENSLSNVSVTLYSAETNEVVAKSKTDGSGTYIFDKLSNGKYYVIFGYDTTKFALTEYQKKDVDGTLNSDAILTNALAITDIITINNNSIGNIDIGLIEASVFDLSLDKSVTKITVQTHKETKAYEFDNSKFAKVDIHSKELEGAGVYMEYKITVANKGEVAGYAKTIVDYIPEGTIFNPNLNPGWYEGPDGLIYSKALENEIINPGEGKSIKLVLFKQMTEENTGIVSNSAEIAETFNEEGIEDIDSVPGNGLDNEDDLGTADIVISVETGGTFISGAVFVVFVIVALVGVYIFKKNVLERVRRW